MKELKTDVGLQFEGRITVEELLDGTLDGRTRLVGYHKNIITDLAYDELLPRIIGRDFNADIGIISIGTGGNYTQAGVNTGVRVPPAATDDQMRVELFRAGIVQINFPTDGVVEFVGLLRQAEAVSADIDEFGLLSHDGRMFSHVINPDSGPATPTVPYNKPNGAIYSIKWALTLARC